MDDDLIFATSNTMAVYFYRSFDYFSSCGLDVAVLLFFGHDRWHNDALDLQAQLGRVMNSFIFASWEMFILVRVE